MSKQTNLYVTQKVRTPMAQILQADGVTAKLLYTASTDDAILKMLQCTSTDVTNRVVQVLVEDPSGNQRLLGSVPIPLGSGSNGSAAAVDLLNSVYMPGLVMDQNGKRVLPLEAGYKVRVKSTGGITASTSLDFSGVVEEY